MVSFMADVIGIRDDMYIGKGHAYQKEFMDSVTEGNQDAVVGAASYSCKPSV